MSQISDLLGELAAAENNKDLAGMRAIRERIVAADGTCVEAAEALYKIGIDALFRERDIEGSIGHLEQAAKLAHAYWAAAARTSLGLCYYHQKRLQKALFELRKVGYVREPSVHSVTALSFIENIHLSENNRAEAQRVRRDRVVQLEEMLSAGRSSTVRGQERGHYLHQLGLALLDMRERDRARVALEEARGLGAQVLGHELMQSIQQALLA